MNIKHSIHQAFWVSACWALAIQPAAQQPAGPPHQQHARPGGIKPAVIFVPGVTGSRLEDPATGEVLWGDATQLLSPKDRGYSTVLPLHPETSSRSRFVPTGILSHMRLLTYTREVYRPLQRALIGAGHQLGDLDHPASDKDLYYFTYDWRRENQQAVEELHQALTHLAQRRGDPRVRLLCQSNAGRICRYVAKYGGSNPAQLLSAHGDQAALTELLGSPEYSIELIVLISNSHGGALRQLHELHKGRKYVPGIGRFMGPETLFALRTLFEDLPFYRDDLFLDKDGVPLKIDLFDPESWRRYQWSIFAPEITDRLNRSNPNQMFGTPNERFEYLSERLAQARQVNRLLISDSPLPAPALCLLQNTTAPSIERALLFHDPRRRRWRLLFEGDRGVPKELKPLLTSPGDGHGTETSQNHLSSQELAAVTTRHKIKGGHFDSITKQQTLDKLLECLAFRSPP